MGPSESDRGMPPVGNGIEPEKAGKSGVNSRIYQSFYSISEEDI